MTQKRRWAKLYEMLSPSGQITNLEVQDNKLIITHQKNIPEQFQITLDGMEIKAVIRDLVNVQREEAIEECMKEVEAMKPNVKTMQHDLQCKCDFEKMEILNKIIFQLQSLKISSNE